MSAYMFLVAASNKKHTKIRELIQTGYTFSICIDCYVLFIAFSFSFPSNSAHLPHPGRIKCVI